MRRCYDAILLTGSNYRKKGFPEGAENMSQAYTMKQACEETGLSYETLKFYCNQGLVPYVMRDANNRRVFDKHAVDWIKGLGCLRRCGLSIREMQEYLGLCLQGPTSIPERKEMLAAKRVALEEKLAEVTASIDYIDWKQGFYDDVLAGKTEYVSSLVPPA